MSGTLPTSPETVTIKFDSWHGMTESKSLSGRSFRRLIGGHYWAFTFKYSGALSRADAMKLLSFFQGQKNGFDTFTTTVPGMTVPLWVATGTPLVNGASQVGSSIITDGWTVSITGILKAGDILKFANHTKVYMVTADANSNGSGQATISISPALVQSPADNSAITISSVPFNVRCTSETSGYFAAPGGFYSIEQGFVEVY